MASPAANLVNLERVHKSYGVRPLLDGVSLGVGVGERVGVVGRNGDGKTTLLRVIGGLEEPDDGRVSRSRGLHLGYLTQGDDLDPDATVGAAVLGDLAEHEWAADAFTREIVEVLLAGVPLERTIADLSGGERRRCSLARLLLGDHDLIVLDEPTNHLDVEAVSWLADHLARRSSALVVVTHDRWFLDAVCDTTWEVHDGVVDVYDGGYAAFVLAKAERRRQAAASEARRQNLMRKELAWLRRGAPARTSKPKFRIEAANALIEGEPPPRDSLELQRFATQRLGKDVLDVEDVRLERGERVLLDHATWRLGPGDRVGLVGVNGAGKTSVLRLLAGDLEPSAGRVKRGRTVALEQLSQGLDELDPQERVLETVENIKRVTRTATGEVTASSMLERFGFTGDRLTTRIGDLSGGERRRLQMMRLLLSEPNVLLLDEPTNDLDIETLTVLEDFLDSWPGTLVVVSHDRYFLERVCDSVWALMGDGDVKMLPRGVDEYLERRREMLAAGSPTALRGAGGASGLRGDGEPPNQPRSARRPDPSTVGSPSPLRPDSSSPVVDAGGTPSPLRPDSTAPSAASSDASGSGASKPEPKVSAAERREAQKALARVEKQLARVTEREDRIHAEILEHATDHEKLAELDGQLQPLLVEKEALEEEWLAAAELVD